MAMTRRHFLGALGGSAVTRPTIDGAASHVFAHGVASGDPLHDGVILWTRVEGPPETDVRFELATDEAMTHVVSRGSARTAASRDWTIKVDVTGLASATTYYYRFDARGERSPIGRTRTLPVGPAGRLKLGFTSCANMPSGYFNVYQCLAERDDLDAVLHLGDYLYEFPNLVYGDGTPLRRAPVPNREIFSLGDYRARHAQYKRDADLATLHRRHPMIAVWDDHEIANNAWRGGASNHQPLEGDWEKRRDAARRAYFEWMPVRENVAGNGTLYRSFSCGGIADIIMLDTRIDGRDRQPPFGDLAAMNDPGRTLLGSAQESWLLGELERSQRAGTRWKVLGQQVLMGQNTPHGTEVLNVDQWDGYRASRSRLFDFVAGAGIDNLVVLTGDLHSSWALELTPDPWDPARYDPDTGRGAIGVEFVTPSVTSPGPFRKFASPQARADEVVAANPHQKWAEVAHRGYAVLTLDPAWAQSDWYHVPTIAERGSRARWVKGFRTTSRRHHLREMAGPAS